LTGFPPISHGKPEIVITWDLLQHIVDSAYFLFGVAATIVTLAAAVLTRPRCQHSIVEEYFDDESGKYVQIFDCNLEFAGNPLFRKIKLFKYPSGTNYQISAFEAGSDDTTLPDGSFEDEDGEVSISEKSILKHGKISVLRVMFESKAQNYGKKIKAQIRHDRIEIMSENTRVVKKFAIYTSRLRNAQELRKNPKIYDVYKQGKFWVIRINCVPAKVMTASGKDTIWF
jgi:hypothetical protein